MRSAAATRASIVDTGEVWHQAASALVQRVKKGEGRTRRAALNRSRLPAKTATQHVMESLSNALWTGLGWHQMDLLPSTAMECVTFESIAGLTSLLEHSSLEALAAVDDPLGEVARALLAVRVQPCPRVLQLVADEASTNRSLIHYMVHDLQAMVVFRRDRFHRQWNDLTSSLKSSGVYN
eukprot:1895299-Amphidinium_carterae.1